MHQQRDEGYNGGYNRSCMGWMEDTTAGHVWVCMFIGMEDTTPLVCCSGGWNCEVSLSKCKEIHTQWGACWCQMSMSQQSIPIWHIDIMSQNSRLKEILYLDWWFWIPRVLKPPMKKMPSLKELTQLECGEALESLPGAASARSRTGAWVIKKKLLIQRHTLPLI